MVDGVNQETEELFGQRKGMGYGELLVDNILGLDNEYESFGEKLGKGISEDYLGFLKQAAIGAYEGAKEFVSDPVGVVTDVATDIKDSVQRLGTEDLDSRIRRMYGVGYSEATDEQVNQAREAVLGDALTALELVPAAKGVQVVGKAAVDAVPSGIKADVVGQTKAMLSGDKEFLTATPTDRATTQSLSAAVPEPTTDAASIINSLRNKPDSKDYVYIVHGGADFKGLPDLAYQNTGEGASFGLGAGLNPLGKGMYGFVVDPSNDKKARYAIEFSNHFGEKYGTRHPKRQNTGVVGKLAADPDVDMDTFEEAVKKELGEPVPGKLHLFRIKKEDFKKQRSENLPIGLTEVAVSDPSLLQRVGSFTLGVKPKVTPEDTKPKSQVNPLFKDFKDQWNPRLNAINPRQALENRRRWEGGTGTISFYNPIESALENLPMKESGMTGKQIKAYLTKRAPNVSKKNLEYSNLTKSKLDKDSNLTQVIKDDKVYTKDEILSLVRQRQPNVVARVLRGEDFVAYPGQQLQNNIGLFDEDDLGGLYGPSDYYEVAIDQMNNENRKFSKEFHYGENNLAHSRATVHTTRADYEPFILIEEFQSDAVQNIGLDKRLQIPENEFIDQGYEALEEFAHNVEMQEDFLNPFVTKESLRELATIASKTKGEEANVPEVAKKIEEYFKKAQSDSYTYIAPEDISNVRVSVDEMDEVADLAEFTSNNLARLMYTDNSYNYSAITDEIHDVVVGDLFDAHYKGGWEGRYAADNLEVKPEDVPVRLTDTVKQSLMVHFMEAKKRGIDTIVLPSLSKIVEARRAQGASEKGLANTYDKAFNKALRELNSELNNKITVTKQPLPYSTGDSTATFLNISDLDINPDTVVPRFNKGGSVMDQEMNNLMQQGGLKTDGMDKDPVSGNPVPPGSLAKEVRDDVPAQLSEGEYVVPADVVRYFGVGYFEKLRDKAKSGLNKMEQTGRIGGEPMTPQQMPQMPPMPQGVPQQMQAGGYVMSGYAPGGDVSSEVSQVEAAKTFDPTQYATPGMSYINRAAQLQGSPFGGITYVEYISADGTTRIMIPFINGVAQVPIPEGYIPTSEYQAQEDVESEDISGDEEQQQQQQQQRDDTPTQQAVQEAGTTGWETESEFRNFTNEEWLKWSEEQGSGNMLKFLPGTAGLIAGTVSELDAVADMRSGIAIAAMSGADEETLAEMQKMLEKYEDRLSPFERKIDQGKLIPTSGYKQVLSHLESRGVNLSEEQVGQIQSRLEDGSITSEDISYLQNLGRTSNFAVSEPTEEYTALQDFQSQQAEEDPYGMSTPTGVITSTGERIDIDRDDDSPVTMTSFADRVLAADDDDISDFMAPTIGGSSSGTTTGSASSGSGRNTFVQDLANLFTPFDDQEYVGGELKKTSSTAKKTAKPTPAPKKNTTNDVNRTGSDVTIGKTSPSGRDAGDGFVWEKKAGTNALTRKWVGN